jgi:hypothetical protein
MVGDRCGAAGAVPSLNRGNASAIAAGEVGTCLERAVSPGPALPAATIIGGGGRSGCGERCDAIWWADSLTAGRLVRCLSLMTWLGG